MFEQFDYWRFIAGLGVFLLGMHQLELGLKDLAGRPFKILLRYGTANIFVSILIGTLATALLQSSSVVSLMTLAFVGAGIFQLRHALGVILGANLGTTFTGWVVVLLGFQIDVEALALPMLGVGSLTMLFLSRWETLPQLGKVAAGFGLLFLGLSYMKDSTSHLAQTLPLGVLQGHYLITYVIFGFVVTALIQSSSAMVVITLSALHSGLFGLEAAGAIVIGANLGTTMTALIGATQGSSTKKQVALANIIFNLIPAAVALFFIQRLFDAIIMLFPNADELFLLAMFHTTFNFLGILLFLPFLSPLSRWLESTFNHKKSGLFKALQEELSQNPEAGYLALKKATVELVKNVIDLNQEGLGLGAKPAARFGFRRLVFDDVYQELKRAEGQILDLATDLHTANLEKAQAEGIQHLCLAAREAVQSAKGIKDIRHNLAELRDSSDDLSFAYYQEFSQATRAYYQDLSRILERPEASTPGLFTEHEGRLKDSFQRRMVQIQGSAKKLDEVRTSNLLNLNRELYLSNCSILLALKEVHV